MKYIKAYYINNGKCTEIKGFGIAYNVATSFATLQVLKLTSLAFGCSDLISFIGMQLVDFASKQ